MENESERLLDEWHCLHFAVRRSQRYHCRRRAFFDNLGHWLAFLTIIFGGSAIFGVSGPDQVRILVAIAGALIAVFSAVDLVIGFSKSAQVHSDLERDFIALEKQMTKEPPSEEALSRFKHIRLEIEEKEPETKRALDWLCRNETIRAMELDPKEMADLKWYHRWFAQVWNFDSDTIKLKRECPPANFVNTQHG